MQMPLRAEGPRTVASIPAAVGLEIETRDLPLQLRSLAAIPAVACALDGRLASDDGGIASSRFTWA